MMRSEGNPNAISLTAFCLMRSQIRADLRNNRSVFNLELYPMRSACIKSKLAYYYTLLHLSPLIYVSRSIHFLPCTLYISHVYARMFRTSGTAVARSMVARCITAAIADARNVLNQVLTLNLSDVEPDGKDLKARYFAICAMIVRCYVGGYSRSYRVKIPLLSKFVPFFESNGGIIYTKLIPDNLDISR